VSSIKSNKLRGASTETVVRNWLRDRYGWDVERIRLSGVLDRGDLTGVPGLMIEVKSTKLVSWSLMKWVRECRRQAKVVDADWVLVVRPHRRPHPRQYFALYENGLFLPGESLHLIPAHAESTAQPSMVIEGAEEIGLPPVGLVSCTVTNPPGIYCERAPQFFTRYYNRLNVEVEA